MIVYIMKQSEFKRHHSEMGQYVKKHIYGGGISAVFKLMVKKCLDRL